MDRVLLWKRKTPKKPGSKKSFYKYLRFRFELPDMALNIIILSYRENYCELNGV